MKLLLTYKVNSSIVNLLIWCMSFYICQALLVETLIEDDQKRPEQEMEIIFEPGLQETAEQLVQRKLSEFYFQP